MIRKSTATVLLSFSFVAWLGRTQAEPAKGLDSLQKENAALRARVGKLEADLEALKRVVNGLAGQKEAVAAPEGLTAEDVRTIKEMTRSGKSPVVSGLKAELYGYVKLDAAYDTSRTDIGNYARYALSEETNEDDDQFSMTAKQTRIGLNLSGLEAVGAKSSGKVEIDFYGGGASGEHRANPMMRHAYLKLDWPGDLSLLAGQTSDVISPLVPSTLNYIVAWWAGNIGYRRPQVRLTKAFELTGDVGGKLELAATRSIGGGNDFSGDAGEDAGIPGFQARQSVSFPFIAGRKASLGVSGHWSQEEYDRNTSGTSRDVDSWSLNLDLTVPVTDVLTLKGEAFLGANLAEYLGGINQGVNATTLREISSAGGWIAASIGPVDRWKLNLGGSLEDVDEDDLSDGGRKLNSSIFGNAIYSVTKSASVGLELSRWYTEYKGQEEGDSFRIQASFMYSF